MPLVSWYTCVAILKTIPHFMPSTGDTISGALRCGETHVPERTEDWDVAKDRYNSCDI